MITLKPVYLCSSECFIAVRKYADNWRMEMDKICDISVNEPRYVRVYSIMFIVYMYVYV